MKKKALLLDRDGVINEEHGYIGTIDRFAFKKGLFSFLRKAIDRGYCLVLVTNQAGVAHGYYTKDDFKKLTAHINQELRAEGIGFDLIQACFEHPEAKVESLRRMSFWRKPNPGMMLEAASKLNLDLSLSIMVGDSRKDMQAGKSAGVGMNLWLGSDAHMDGAETVTDFSDAEKYL